MAARGASRTALAGLVLNLLQWVAVRPWASAIWLANSGYRFLVGILYTQSGRRVGVGPGRYSGSGPLHLRLMKYLDSEPAKCWFLLGRNLMINSKG